jgi:hypothetical protein
MEVIVDGDRHFPVPGNPEDMLALIASLSDALREQGRAILSIEADGKEVHPNDLIEAFSGRAVEDAGLIRIETEEIAQMVGKCLDELEQSVPELPAACRSLAGIFQSEAPESGFEPFQELARIWSFIKTRQSLVLSALDLDLETCSLEGVPLVAIHSELNGFLEEAAQATKFLDYTLLGDLLEYELAPRAEQEAAIVALLREYAAARSG